MCCLFANCSVFPCTPSKNWAFIIGLRAGRPHRLGSEPIASECVCESGEWKLQGIGVMSVRAPGSSRTMAGYEFGFLLEQSLGHVTHSQNLLTNVALDPEVRAHWGLIDFEARGIARR